MAARKAAAKAATNVAKVATKVAKAATKVAKAATTTPAPRAGTATKATGRPAPKAEPKAAPTPARKAAPVPAVKKARALTGPALRAQADELHRRLGLLYPDAHCELDFETPLQLVVATILSAQCTDKRVNMVTPALFAAYPTAQALADAPVEHLEELVKTTGFFRMKAKNIQGMARALVERHGGEVPADMDALVQLPGVGRKTANVVLGNAFKVNHGVVVDTHVGRLAVRLGLTRETDPIKVEEALMPLFPRESWTMLSHLLIFHGRRVCDARKPRCGDCTLADVCPSAVR